MKPTHLVERSEHIQKVNYREDFPCPIGGVSGGCPLLETMGHPVSASKIHDLSRSHFLFGAVASVSALVWDFAFDF
jgi:hypothetical protein